MPSQPGSANQRVDPGDGASRVWPGVLEQELADPDERVTVDGQLLDPAAAFDAVFIAQDWKG